METNILYYGENLEILRKYIPDDSIDLIYLDPPFNSQATYNLLFREPTGERSEAQIKAFEDTWHWTEETERESQEIVDTAPVQVVEMIHALRSFIGRNDMMAYLTRMCIRLLELKRVLSRTGSIYLHCDPTASHYLKIVMDAIFGARNFRNEIVWTMRGIGRKRRISKFPTDTQILLFYTKSSQFTFNEQTWEEHIPKTYKGGQFILPPGYSRDAKGRVFWTSPRGDYTEDSIQHLEQEGRIYRTSKGTVRVKYFVKEADTHLIVNRPVTNSWSDIPDILRTGRQRLGYPTQKPEALLERVIQASSNPGEIVLDPFCGCGTALVVAERFGRRWIGIDITHLAIGIMKWRLDKMFPGIQYQVIGEPKDLAGARELASQNRYQFQWWGLSLIGARPYGNDRKKGADTGIDGICYFMNEKEKPKRAIVSVKSGKVSVGDVRDLGHVIDREGAPIGILLTLESPSRNMIKEAVGKGFYRSPQGIDYPKIQILTIGECLQGKRPNLPLWVSPIPAPRVAKKVVTQDSLPFQ